MSGQDATELDEMARRLIDNLDNRNEWAFMGFEPNQLIELIRVVVRDELAKGAEK